MNTEIIRRTFGALTITALAVTLGGCAAGEDGSMAQDTGEEPVAEAAQAATGGVYWTKWISEETPDNKDECTRNDLITAVEIKGGYADEIRLGCTGSYGTRVANTSKWTGYISEEAPGNFVICDENYWMVGLQCTGKNCDNVSIKCARFTGFYANSCSWTMSASEEEGKATIPWGKAVRGVMCKDKYCDKMSFCVADYLVVNIPMP